MIKIVICDDEYDYRKHISHQLSTISQEKQINIEISEYPSGKLMITKLDEWIENAHVIFLDIKLRTENGIEVGIRLRKLGYRGEIVFLTTSREEVFNAFEVKPMNYLLKSNMSYENLSNEFDKIIRMVYDNKLNMFSYQIGQEKFLIPLSRIISFEARKRKVRMCYIDRNLNFAEVEFYSPLEDVEAKVINSFFLKPHRSYLVNPSFIDRVSKTQFVLSNGEFISITRSYKERFFKDFNKYLRYIGVEL